jgi:hypothetical protein
MTQHSPMTEFLRDIQERLKKLNIPIYLRLPGAEVPEPFVVIGQHFDDDTPSAKTGPAIVSTNLQIDIFISDTDRTVAEDMIYQAKALLGRRKNITSEIIVDNTIGRQVYHIIINVTDYVI